FYTNGVIEDFQNELNNEKTSNSETIADLPIKDSLLMVDEQINTTHSTESDEIKKSSVEIFNPIPRESNDAKECEISIKGNSMESKFKVFENMLFEQNKEFSSYDESSSKVENKFDTFKCFSNPFFKLDEEIITLEKDVFQNVVISNQEKINDTCETEGDLKFFDDLLNEDPLPPDVFNVENDFQDNKEEIDIDYRRKCEDKIYELKDKFNGLSIEIQKITQEAEELRESEARARIQKIIIDDDTDDDDDYDDDVYVDDCVDIEEDGGE
ncbi:hypothetical protein Tco_0141103, partial [Tanacetum coccineum]